MVALLALRVLVIEEKYCYFNLEESCNIFGGLYRWDEAMNYTDNPQGICPMVGGLLMIRIGMF